MKRCPQCHQFFDDENLFCLNDGTELREDFPASAASNSVPTQVIPSISRETAVKKSSGKEIYWLCGALLLVVAALSFVIFALAWKPDRRSTEEKSEKAAENPNAKSPPKNETVEPSKAAELPPLTEQTARALIERWEKAQDARNFNAYKSCYAPSFFGVKRTKSGGETRMNYAEWLADRRKMLANTIDVGVRNLDVAIDGDTATARFVQQFQSVNYNDEGQKILKLKMFEDGAKIVYEEMKYSY